MLNSADASKLNRQIKDMNDELKKLSQQSQSTERQIDDLNTSFSESITSFSGTSEELQKINTLLDESSNKGAIFEGYATQFNNIVGAANTASSAVTDMSNKMKNQTSTFDLVTTGIQTVSDILVTAATGGGIAIASMAVSGLLTLLNEVSPAIRNQIDPIGELTNEMESTKGAYDKLKQSQEEQLLLNLSNIDYTQQLVQEMDSLIDQNGNVKAGYEDRVRYIYDKLKPALGDSIQWTNEEKTAISMNTEEIQKNMNMRKAQMILKSKEGTYLEALKNMENGKQAENDSKIAYQQAKKDLEELQLRRLQTGEELSYQISAAEDKLKAAEEDMKKQNDIMLEYQKDIYEYENLQQKIASGDESVIAEINSSVSSNYSSAAMSSVEELQGNVDYALLTYENLKEQFNNGVAGITDEMVLDARDKWIEAKEALKEGTALSIEALRESLLSDVIEDDDSGLADTLKNLGFDVGKSLNENIADGVLNDIQVIRDAGNDAVIGFTSSCYDSTIDATPELINLFNSLGVQCNTTMENGLTVEKLTAPDVNDIDAGTWTKKNVSNIQSNFNKPENAIKITAQMGVTAMDVHATNTTGSWTIAVAPHKYTGYASGGFVDKEQLSWIAEGDKPEVVIPLDPGKRTRAMQLFAQTSELLGVSVQARNGFPLGDSLSPSTSVVDYSRLAALITDSLKSSAIQCNPVFQVSQGDVYLDSEKAGRALTPVISRIQAKTAKFETR
ncbi:hypothetical protein [Massilioclostridium coli]|uniref:hypothetical protein n=1 Tax=Massilioclostridium coli TaxID=1870991 RepID=UPI00085C29A2|nr:hypothetical protein [Massilioclostridium coli]